MTAHAEKAAAFVANDARMHWHDTAVWHIRTKRDKASSAVPEWEELRTQAAALKAHTISRLAEYLEAFERNAVRLGAVVHWASTPAEHNAAVLSILEKRGVKRLVKSKSMLTEECHLNDFLEKHGVEVIDTDLGERIVQLAKEPPSHIVMPAIHKKREEIGELFHEHLKTEAGASDPKYLTEAARGHLREKFLAAEAGLTGVNFAVAETGGFVVCTNEGNADLGVSLPPIHIACMGVEKLVARAADLAVFLRLLARSGTGQPVTTYTSHFHGPRPGGELHLVIVDNGRSALLASETHRRALSCIRCGACMNTCPVYRRSGGFSYDATVPGPIGSVLAPSREPERYAGLPFASSLCGSCDDVCPVKIDLHQQLLAWRHELSARRLTPAPKRLAARLGSFVLRRPWLYNLLGFFGRAALRWTPRGLLARLAGPWGRQRELPPGPRRSFRAELRRRRAGA
ncbi:MAG TPA: lactate utilization protein B [Myxococcaceae bacterium]|nr:lactate utilization protein B [Myxococcaceae bacterium]